MPMNGLNHTPSSPLLQDDGSLNIMINGMGDLLPIRDPATGALEIRVGDDVLIDLNPKADQQGYEDFDENIAERLSGTDLASIANELITCIDDDDRSRAEWLQMRAKGLDLLGIKVEQPRGDVGGSAAPVEGQSTVRHPLLNEAVMRFQANAYAELCPANGPAKVVNYSDQNNQNDDLADALERDLNYYLTSTATEYYEETRRLLWWVGYGGMMFKKVYYHPLKRRPVSEMVDAKDLIVSNEATDLESAGRVTQIISMRKSTMKRMQMLGVYRDIDLIPQTSNPDAVDRKIGTIEGIDTNRNRQEDADYQLYECYCELDIPGFEHVDDNTGEETGLPLPYRVTIDKVTRNILEIRRNWDEGDEDTKAKIPFIPFTYVSGPGFYGIGLLQILGNTTNAATAAWRLLLDAGMFNCFPGFLYAKQGNRQLTNEFRIAPGSGMPIDVGNGSIRDAVMPLPYKEPSAALMSLIQEIVSTGQRVGGTAEIPVGEGVQNAPVGTTLALIEQATKIESAVHKGLHRAQDNELKQIVELFRQYPKSLWMNNRRSALDKNDQLALEALENCDITPRSDPNVPSRQHRMAKVAALIQLATTAPMKFNQDVVITTALREIGYNDPETFLAPPQAQPGPDPIEMMKVTNEAKKNQIAEIKTIGDLQNAAKERESKVLIETLNIAERIATHPESLPAVGAVLGGLSGGRPQWKYGGRVAA